jgi:ABC-2 type transport system permease protein
MGIVWQEAVLHAKVFSRQKSGAFWAYLFPILLLALFCSVFGSGPEDATAMLAGVICINSMSGAFYGVGVSIVSLREQKILRRYKVTPVALWKVLLGLCLAQAAIIGLGTLLLILAAKAFYRVALPANAPAFILIFFVSTFMFCAIAFAIASVARSGYQAGAIAQALFVPMMFLSGATLPSERMPAWIQKVAVSLPATYLVDGMRRVFAGEGLRSNLGNLVVMLIFSILAGAFSLRFFRWE